MSSNQCLHCGLPNSRPPEDIKYEAQLLRSALSIIEPIPDEQCMALAQELKERIEELEHTI